MTARLTDVIGGADAATSLYLGGSIDPLSVAALCIAVISVILAIVLFTRLGKLNKRLDTLMRGSDAASLEDEIVELFNDNRYLSEQTAKNTEEIEHIRKMMRRHLKKTGIVKYDAFHQMGGELSYVVAMLDDRNNGFLINSVHSSEGCYSYIKEVRKGVCELELGNEEAEALEKAMRSGSKAPGKGEESHD